MELGVIADVIIGVLVNREQNYQGNISYTLFNIKTCNDDKIKTKINTNKNLDRKLTKVGDILFQLTYPNNIIYIDEVLKDLLVTSQMCIIRPNEKIINSKYLKWYLESDKGREQIMLNINGSSIKKISVNDLRKINIPVLDMEKQKKISDLMELWEKEKDILQTLIQKKDFLYKSIINGIVEGYNE